MVATPPDTDIPRRTGRVLIVLDFSIFCIARTGSITFVGFAFFSTFSTLAGSILRVVTLPSSFGFSFSRSFFVRSISFFSKTISCGSPKRVTRGCLSSLLSRACFVITMAV